MADKNRTSGVKMGPKIPGVIKDPVKVKPIPMSVLKKIMGIDVPLAIKKKDGGLAEAIEKVKAKEMEKVVKQFHPSLKASQNYLSLCNKR